MRPLPAPLKNWRIQPDDAIRDDAFVNTIMVMWRSGMNTADMARKLVQSESAIASALRIGRERERNEQAGKP